MFGEPCYTECRFSTYGNMRWSAEEERMLTFNHFNFNVADLETSLRFYKDALGLEPGG